MNNFVLKEKEEWKYTLEEYIKTLEEYKYIDCNDYDYEFWYILEKLKELDKIKKEIK